LSTFRCIISGVGYEYASRLSRVLRDRSEKMIPTPACLFLLTVFILTIFPAAYCHLGVSFPLVGTDVAWGNVLGLFPPYSDHSDLELITGNDITGPRVTNLYDFKMKIGKDHVAIVPGDGNIVPQGRDAMFKVWLASHDPYPNFWIELGHRHVHFYFYDSAGNMVYHERDNTNIAGKAQVKIPNVRKGKKIKGPGWYRLEVRYGGNHSDMLYPCSRAAEIEFQ